jgi:tetratricopeptide (TPR) repeat protein
MHDLSMNKTDREKHSANKLPTRYLISALILIILIVAFYPLCLRFISQFHYLKAGNHIREGNYETAVKHLKKAIHRQPDDPLIWKRLGKAYRNLEMPMLPREAFHFAKKAEHAYRMATRLNPFDAEACYGLARETAKLEQLNSYLSSHKGAESYNALPYFQKAISLRPNGILYHYALARYLHQQKKNSELLGVVSNLIRIYPSVYSSLKKEAFWSSEVNEAAKKGMHLAIKEKIASRNTHMTLSSLLADEKDWDGAISHYQTALALQSMDNNSGNFYQLGRLYLENKQFEEAEESFFMGLSKSKAREKDLENIYRFYKVKGYSEELYRFYHRVSKNFILSGRIDILLARSLIDLNKYHQAKQTLMDHNQKEPSTEAYYWLARIAEIEKDWDSMELAIQKATVLDPKNSRYHLIFSQVLKRINKLERAEKAAGMAIKHSAKPSPGLFNHRAWIRWSRNDFPGAAKDWQAAIQLEPDNAYFYVRTAEAYIKSGKWSHAIDHYQKAINLDSKNASFRKKYNELKAAHKEK